MLNIIYILAAASLYLTMGRTWWALFISVALWCGAHLATGVISAARDDFRQHGCDWKAFKSSWTGGERNDRL